MKEALNNLKGKSIIDNQKVEVIRRYIKTRFPDAPQKQQTAIFADAVHKLIDGNISQFSENNKKSIKDTVFRKAATRTSFFINADEIFRSALAIKNTESDYFDSLESWVSVNQDSKVTREELILLAEKLKDVSFEELEEKLEEVIIVIDEQIKIEERIKEIPISIGLNVTSPEKKEPKKTLFKDAIKEPVPHKQNELDEQPEQPEKEQEGFSKKDADTFFDVINENENSRKKFFTAPEFIFSKVGKRVSSILKRLAPGKKAKLQEVLVQMIILLILILTSGTLFALGEQGKTYIKIPEQITEKGTIIDAYSDVFDIYLTKKSKNLR